MSFLVSKEDFQEFLQEHYRADAETAQNLSDFVDAHEDTLQRNDGFIDLENAEPLIGKAAQGYVSQFNPENALPFTTAYNAYLEKKQGANPAKVANLVPNQDAPREYSGFEKAVGNPESLQAAAVVANGENPVANFSHQNLLQGLQNDFASACDYLNQPFPKSMELLAFVFTEHNLGDSYGSTTPALRDSLIALGQEPQAALVMAEKLNTVFLGLTKNNPAFLPIRLALMTKPHGQSFDDFLNSTNENGIDYRTLMYRAVQDLITNSDTGFANAVYEFAPQIEDGKKAQLKRISQVLGQWGDMNPAESAAALVCVALENPEQTKEIENRLGYSLDKFTAAMQHCERVMDPQKGRVSAGYFGPSPLFFELTDEQNQFIIATALAIKEAEFFEGAKQNLIMVSAILLPMLAAKVFAAAVLVKVAAGGVVGLAVQAAQEGDAHIERENEFTQTQAYQAAGAFGEKEIFGVTAEDVIADDKYNTAADNAALARIAFGAASGVFVAPGKGVQLLVTDTFSGAVMATGDAVVGQHVFTENGLEEENAMALSDAFLMGAFVGGALNLGTSLGGSTVKGVKGLFGGTPKTPTPRTAQAPGLKYRSLNDGPTDFTKQPAGDLTDNTLNKKPIAAKDNKETAGNKLNDEATPSVVPVVVGQTTRNLADAGEQAGLVTEPMGRGDTNADDGLVDLQNYRFNPSGEEVHTTPATHPTDTTPQPLDTDAEDMAIPIAVGDGNGQYVRADVTTDSATPDNVVNFPGADAPRNATGGGDSGDGSNAPGQGKRRWGTGRQDRIEPGRGQRRSLPQDPDSATPDSIAKLGPSIELSQLDTQGIAFAPENHRPLDRLSFKNDPGRPRDVLEPTRAQIYVVNSEGKTLRVIGVSGPNNDVVLCDADKNLHTISQRAFSDDYLPLHLHEQRIAPQDTRTHVPLGDLPAAQSRSTRSFNLEEAGLFRLSTNPDGTPTLTPQPRRRVDLNQNQTMPAATRPTSPSSAARPADPLGQAAFHSRDNFAVAASLDSLNPADYPVPTGLQALKAKALALFSSTPTTQQMNVAELDPASLNFYPTSTTPAFTVHPDPKNFPSTSSVRPSHILERAPENCRVALAGKNYLVVGIRGKDNVVLFDGTRFHEMPDDKFWQLTRPYDTNFMTSVHAAASPSTRISPQATIQPGHSVFDQLYGNRSRTVQFNEIDPTQIGFNPSRSNPTDQREFVAPNNSPGSPDTVYVHPNFNDYYVWYQGQPHRNLGVRGRNALLFDGQNLVEVDFQVYLDLHPYDPAHPTRPSTPFQDNTASQKAHTSSTRNQQDETQAYPTRPGEGQTSVLGQGMSVAESSARRQSRAAANPALGDTLRMEAPARPTTTQAAPQEPQAPARSTPPAPQPAPRRSGLRGIPDGPFGAQTQLILLSGGEAPARARVAPPARPIPLEPSTPPRRTPELSQPSSQSQAASSSSGPKIQRYMLNNDHVTSGRLVSSTPEDLPNERLPELIGGRLITKDAQGNWVEVPIKDIVVLGADGSPISVTTGVWQDGNFQGHRNRNRVYVIFDHTALPTDPQFQPAEIRNIRGKDPKETGILIPLNHLTIENPGAGIDQDVNMVVFPEQS